MTDRGIDVGIEYIGEPTKGKEEHFLEDNNHILTQNATIYDIKLKKGAEVLSDVDTSKGVIPMSYRYENDKGQRFLVININTRENNDTPLKHYARSRQYAQEIPWLGGNKLPAYVYGNPALYMQCKKGEGSMTVGLWNFFADTAIEPVVELDKAYSQIEFLNCNGRIDGSKIYLSDIPPFGFVAFEVR